MRLKLHLAILITIFAATASAQNNGACRSGYSSEVGTLRDSAEAATVFAGKPRVKRFRTAISYIRSQSYGSREALISDIDRLFELLTLMPGDLWEYRKLDGLDHSTIYVGWAGPVIVVDPEGRLFKGMGPYDLFHHGTWRPDYDELVLLEPLDKNSK